MNLKNPLSLLLFAFVLPVSAAINEPGCDALASWADTFAPPEARSGPGSVPQIFRDEAFAGMFGKVLGSWEEQDFRALDEYMKGCQRALFKKDRQQAKQINKVRRHLPAVQRATEQARQGAAESTAQTAMARAERPVAQTRGAAQASAPPPTAPVPPGGFEIPACDVLHAWVGRLDRDETIRFAPKVEVNSLLRPGWTAPVFGLPAERWDQDQYAAVYEEAIACRDAAKARDDMAAFNRFHQAAKVVGKGGQAMRRVERVRASAAENVDEILGHQGSPALPQIVEAAQMALRGEDPTEFIEEARTRYPKMAYVFSDAKQLAGYTDYLTEADRNGLIERLDAGKAEVVAKSRAIEQELAEARAAVAAAPTTLAGMRSLRELKDAPVLARVGLEEAKAFRVEVQQRQNEIQAELRAREAAREARAEAEANRPIDLAPRLTQLFHGDDLDELSLGGLSLGMAEQRAVATLTNQWQFDYENGVSLYNDFVATRPIYPQLKKERRNGGKLHLGVMDDEKLGLVRYVERYKAMLVTTQPQAWLQKRLGPPDEIAAERGGRLLTWKDGDLRLQVFATNQTDVLWRGAGFVSKVAISLWSEHYETYLADLDERCQALFEQKRERGSISEAIWFAGHCDLVGNARDHVGI